MTEKEAVLEACKQLGVNYANLVTTHGDFVFGSMPAVVRMKAEEILAASREPVAAEPTGEPPPVDDKPHMEPVDEPPPE